MPVANQYGIDVGNIMSTASNIKGARLSQETGEYNLKRKKELDTLAEEKRNNEQLGKMAVQLSSLPVEEQQPAFEKAVSMLSPEIQDTVKAGNYTAQDLPHIINDALSFDQLYTKVIQNPADLRAKKELESHKNEMNIKKENRAQENKLELEEVKQEGKIEIQELKNKEPKKGNKKEFEQLMEKLNSGTLTEAQEKRYKQRLDKISQPSMSSLLINTQTVKNEQRDFATSLGLESPYELSTIDVRTLTEPQKAQANQTASIIVKGLGANAKIAEKKMGEYSAMASQMQNSLESYAEVGEFRVADEITKKYFSNYFGLSADEIKSTEAAQAFQSMANIKIKADSGSAVSGHEMVRNVLESATTFMTKTRIIKGIENVAKRQIGTLEGLKKVMGPIAFNLKYGSVLSNYKDILSASKDAKKTGGKKTLEELREAKAPEKVVAERRKLQDGRIVIKYTDGTYGAE